MNDNFRFCLQLSRCAYILLSFIWLFLSGVRYSWTFPALIFAGYLFIYMLCSFLGSNLDGIDRLYDNFSRTQIFDRCLNNYKIGLGYITFFGVAPFLAFLDSGMDSMVSFYCFKCFTEKNLFFQFSSLCLHICTLALLVVLEILIQPTLLHCDLDSTSMRVVADNMRMTFPVFLFALLTLIVLRVFDLWPSTFTNLMFQVVWVLANFPYYIEFWEMMINPIYVSLVRNGNVVARNNYRNEPNEPNPHALNVMLVRNEDAVVMDNSRGTIPDDSDSSDDPDDEQLPNYPTKVLIDSEDLQCNVCILQYSEKRVPLVLSKCGHSLCKKCCKAAQRQLPHDRFIICPFCRTENPGPIAMLPKNYAIMGIVQKIGQQVIRE
ncbi:hypothetical protein CAEBREN_13469 [Caenorhabditis brenneri]|uniref:RING-type domain-containing protein n=1 Tax=Caenorhabditis brenneri TaxID=135651 RepID=G0M9Y8_CAEBE|nr:hypothetical protein CAEBREN_13469 [Caenorhabditis brenneri]